MNRQQKEALDNVRRIMEKRASYRVEGDGEISPDLLEQLSSNQGGWLGKVAQSFVEALGSNPEAQDSSALLEETAAVLLSWAADLRWRKTRAVAVPVSGSAVLVRVPEHYPRFLGRISDDGRVEVPVLGKTYDLEEVQILPRRIEQKTPATASPEFQKTIKEELDRLRRSSNNY